MNVSGDKLRNYETRLASCQDDGETQTGRIKINKEEVLFFSILYRIFYYIWSVQATSGSYSSSGKV